MDQVEILHSVAVPQAAVFNIENTEKILRAVDLVFHQTTTYQNQPFSLLQGMERAQFCSYHEDPTKRTQPR